MTTANDAAAPLFLYNLNLTPPTLCTRAVYGSFSADKVHGTP